MTRLAIVPIASLIRIAIASVWMLAQVYPVHVIRTVDPADTNFADLAPLQSAVGEARVVILGEQTHGDGATFLLKTRVVKYLHQHMGFDVLVFESGLYDCDRERITGECLLFVWESSAQMQPLIRYLNTSDLAFAGMDIQLTEVAAAQLSHELTAIMQQLDSSLLTSDDGRLFLRVLDDLAASVESNPPLDAQDTFFTVLADVRKIIAQSSINERDFWLRVLDGTEVYAEQIWRFEDTPDGYIRRDVLMGENLVWLANERYAGRKLIVWTGGYHAVRNLHTTRDLSGERVVYSTHTTAADIAYASLGDDMRVFNVTSAAGSYYNWQTNTITAVPLPQPDSLETMLADAGVDIAFVDLRNPGDEWLHGTPAWNYQPLRAEWHNLMDGVFFIHEMTPSERIR